MSYIKLSAIIMMKTFYYPQPFYVIGYTINKGIVYQSALYDNIADLECWNLIDRLQREFKHIHFTIFPF